MKQKIKVFLKNSSIIILSIFIIYLVIQAISYITYAGNLSPAAPPSATMRNLSEIYNIMVGGNESIETVDTGGYYYLSSLQLDSSGYPVISYTDNGTGDLKLVHCNDANCSGSDESIETVNTGGYYSLSSLQLDSSGYPVISYTDNNTGYLVLVHCNDANCSGSDESIETVDTGDYYYYYSSLQLDSSGYPIISYTDDGTGDLKLVHCNDANCSGGDEPIEDVDKSGYAQYTSLQLDSSGYPVISYTDDGTGDLKLVHCNDANCSGGDESIETVENSSFSSLQLDSSGYPVISYTDDGTGDLKLVHCNDANCSVFDSSLIIASYNGNAFQIIKCMISKINTGTCP